MVNSQGKYHVSASTADDCELEDSIYILISHPEIDLEIEYAEGCEPFSVELDAGEGFTSYIWQNEWNDTLSTEQKFIADSTGEFRVTGYDKYGCPARDTMKSKVFPVPDIEITGPEDVCRSKSLQVSVNITNAPESVWNYEGSYHWSRY